MTLWMLRRLLVPFGAEISPPPIETADVCLTATRTKYVYLTASTEHARQCDGGSTVADDALHQGVEAAPSSVSEPVIQLWEFTLPAADVPIGGIGSWTIVVGFGATIDAVATKEYTATVTQAGGPSTDATFTINLNTSDLTGFTFGSLWSWTAWRTDSGQREPLAGYTLFGSHVITVS